MSLKTAAAAAGEGGGGDGIPNEMDAVSEPAQPAKMNRTGRYYIQVPVQTKNVFCGLREIITLTMAR